jgi:hypothetical protein
VLLARVLAQVLARVLMLVLSVQRLVASSLCCLVVLPAVQPQPQRLVV